MHLVFQLMQLLFAEASSKMVSVERWLQEATVRKGDVGKRWRYAK